MYKSFFLGANSRHGFYSFYDELIDLKSADAVYILKGGPGSGKSSLMKKIATAAEEKGYEVERIFCSSDPDSLDGIIIPELSRAVVDGTSPHVVEPAYALAVERYVDLGQFADYPAISKKKNEIIAIKEKYSGFFERVYQRTASAAHIDNEIFDIALSCITTEKLHTKARGIISREIRGKGSGKATKHRFSSAISPKGYVSLFDGKESSFEKTFVLEDNFGIGHFLLVPILKATEEADFRCIACMNPLIPEKLEHLIIPELSLSFITSTKEHPYTGSCYRHLRLDAMVSSALLKEQKARVSVLRKLKTELLGDACEILREAKAVHDEMESLYNPHIAFEELYSFTASLSEEIVK